MRALLTNGDVPPIRPSHAGPVVSRSEAVLMWCFTGETTVTVDVLTHRLVAGRMLWVPPGREMTVETPTDSVLFPIFLPATDLPKVLGEPRLLTAPRGAEDWLIYHFARGLEYLRGATSQSSGLVNFVAHAPDALADDLVLPPRTPQSPEALDVADTLLRNPAYPLTLQALAAHTRTSASTLQRQFLEQTGLSFARWRTQVRLAAAAAYIVDGGRIGQAARRAGFATTSGFTRAFVTHTGITPTEYRRRHPISLSPNKRTPDRLVEDLASLATTAHAAEPPETTATELSFTGEIPATDTWPRVNHFHTVVWAYRGSARVHVADHTWELHQGDAMLLPAGQRVQVVVAPGSLLLPLGNRPGGSPLTADQLTVVQLNTDAELYLLHTMVANFTQLRPHSHDPHAVATSFQLLATTPLGHGPSPTATESVRRIMETLIADPADSRDLADFAQQLGADPTGLRSAFLAETGTTFPKWRAERRMTVARQLLHLGMNAESVGRRVGYAHHSGFTRAFIAAHQMTPTDYQRTQLH